MGGLAAIEKRFTLRIDVELDLLNGYGVNLREMLGRCNTVIGKSMRDVALLSREEAIALLPGDNPS